MTGEKDVLEFELQEKMTFANTKIGDDDETFVIYLRAPTYREMDQAFALEQHVWQAFSKIQDSLTDEDREGIREKQGASKGDDDDKMSGAYIMGMLAMYGDIAQVMRDFEKLALKVATIGEGTDLLAKHYRSLPINELRRMCGAYIAFFIMPSVLSEMEKAFSGD